jgi:prepilin-type N-terminal cleavage/methylation domain-containing protein
MFKLLRRNRKGFTLIELIVVIAILAILAAIAIPTFTTITRDANQRVAVANARNIATAINTYNALYPNETPISAVEGAKTTLTGASLWPSGLTDDDAASANKLIQFENNVAVVDATISIYD